MTGSAKTDHSVYNVIEIRAFERGHVVSDPNIFILLHYRMPGPFMYIVVKFDSHQRFRSSAIA